MPSETRKRPTVELDPEIHRAFSIINTALGQTNRDGASKAIRPFIKKHVHLLPENQKAEFLATS